MRKFAGLLLLTILPSISDAQCWNGQCSPSQPASYSQGSAPEWAVNATCRISDWHGNTANGGTGTVVKVIDDKAYVLTCRHVVEDGSGNIQVTLSNGNKKHAKFLGWSDEHADITVLEIAADEVPAYVPVTGNPVKRGDNVCQVGWGGGRLNQRLGQILGVHSYSQRGWRNHWNTELSFPSISGDSGSGVFDLERKELIGVLWGGGGGTSECCGPEYCFNALECCLKKHRKPGGGGDVPMQPPGSGNQPPKPSVPTAPTTPTQPKPSVPSAPTAAVDLQPLLTRIEKLEAAKPDPAINQLVVNVTSLTTNIDKLSQTITALDHRVSALEKTPKPTAPSQLLTRIEQVKP